MKIIIRTLEMYVPYQSTHEFASNSMQKKTNNFGHNLFMVNFKKNRSVLSVALTGSFYLIPFETR